MALVTAVNPLTGVKHKVARDAAQHAARDTLAALVIEDAAFRGNPDAADFVGEANSFLGAARVHRLRAGRLKKKAAKAAVMGEDQLSQQIVLAAEDEDRHAKRLESSVIRAVRESHQGAFGYVSPEEQSLLNWYAYKDKTSSGVLGKQFEALSQKMISSAYNFGDDSDEAEESPLMGADEIGVAADVLGGDFEAVFGGFAFDDCYGIFKVSKATLRQRLKRKKQRLRKAEKTLGELEDAGKSGLRVKWLQMRVQQIEKAIKRIKGKIGKTRKAKAKVVEAEAEAHEQEAADTEVKKEAALPDEEALDAQEEAEEEEWLREMGENMGEAFGEALDADLFAAIDFYGMSTRRANRIRRRLARLKAKLPYITRERRRERIERRIDKLEGKLESAGMQTQPDEATKEDAYPGSEDSLLLSSPAGASYIENYGYPQTRPDPSLYFGAEAVGERQPYLGFFVRRAATYGASIPDGQGDEFAGFWDAIKNFFSNLGQGTAKVARATGKGIQKGAQATGTAIRTQWSASQAARAESSRHGPQVREAKTQLRSQQETLRQERQRIREERGPGMRETRARMRAERKALRKAQADQRAALRQASESAAPDISQSRSSLRAAKKAQRQAARAARKATVAARRAERHGLTPPAGPPQFDLEGIPDAPITYGPGTGLSDRDERGLARRRAARALQNSQTDSGHRYVSGHGGWSYLQEPSGRITIVEAPRGHTPGAVLTSGPQWEAITSEIGPAGGGHAPAVSGMGSDLASLEAEMGWLEDEFGSSRQPDLGICSGDGVYIEDGDRRLQAGGREDPWREVPGRGGWGYRLHESGKIFVVNAPPGHESAIGKKVRRRSMVNAISAEVGTYRCHRGPVHMPPEVVCPGGWNATPEAQRGSVMNRRHVPGKGGYFYDLYRDGNQVTVWSPSGRKTLVTAQSHPEAWNSIRREVGSYSCAPQDAPEHTLFTYDRQRREAAAAQQANLLKGPGQLPPGTIDAAISQAELDDLEAELGYLEAGY
ncbi:hypothetical protein CMI47_09450 [Candidatus Pacearchaeota archaeon]|nr:hypothetical protein [Candidatus Pacearchaeota archaeon]|tara:strand:- start:5432 stop:8440 length:3009 start_codon:yes stop_codon:yes gene_type:complete